MSVKLRVATLLAAIAIAAGAIFLAMEFHREPPAVQNPAAPVLDKPGSIPAMSDTTLAKVEPAGISAPSSSEKVANPVTKSIPDPRPAVAGAPQVPVSGVGPPSSVGIHPNPGGAMTSQSANPPATAEQREAVVLDLDKVTLMLRDFRTSMGENPTGTNSEIMKAVMGGNPKGARLGPPENQSLNGEGELVDRWGTPLFFHQMSRTSMEIRSAGPDRTMWTDDDILAH